MVFTFFLPRITVFRVLNKKIALYKAIYFLILITFSTFIKFIYFFLKKIRKNYSGQENKINIKDSNHKT